MKKMAVCLLFLLLLSGFAGAGRAETGYVSFYCFGKPSAETGILVYSAPTLFAYSDTEYSNMDDAIDTGDADAVWAAFAQNMDQHADTEDELVSKFGPDFEQAVSEQTGTSCFANTVQVLEKNDPTVEELGLDYLIELYRQFEEFDGTQVTTREIDFDPNKFQ